MLPADCVSVISSLRVTALNLPQAELEFVALPFVAPTGLNVNT